MNAPCATQSSTRSCKLASRGRENLLPRKSNKRRNTTRPSCWARIPRRGRRVENAELKASWRSSTFSASATSSIFCGRVWVHGRRWVLLSWDLDVNLGMCNCVDLDGVFDSARVMLVRLSFSFYFVFSLSFSLFSLSLSHTHSSSARVERTRNNSARSKPHTRM